VTGARARAARAIVMTLAVGGSAVGLSAAAIPAAATPAAGCAPDDAPCVVLHLPGGAPPHVVGASVITGGRVHKQYYTRTAPGQTPVPSPFVGAGLTVRQLIQGSSPGLDPAAITFTDVPRPDGTASILHAAELGDPSPFAAHLDPVVRVSNGAIQYIRPLYDNDADVNAPDELTGPVDGPLDIYVHTGPLLSVTVATAPTALQVPLGAPAHFTATVTKPPAGTAPFSYVWTFGDGTTSAAMTTGEVQHAYTAPGTYPVVASVAGAQGAAGFSAATAIVVVKPVPPKPGPPKHHRPRHHPHKHATRTPRSHHPHRTHHAPGSQDPGKGGHRRGAGSSHHHGGHGHTRHSFVLPALALPTAPPTVRSGAVPTGRAPELAAAARPPASAPRQQTLDVPVTSRAPLTLRAAADSTTTAAPAEGAPGRWDLGLVLLYSCVAAQLLAAGRVRDRRWLGLRRRP
jgi:PKD repeat protein